MSATPVDPRRWQRLEALFEHGASLPPSERASWLAALELGAETRAELAALLAADTGSSTLHDHLGAAVAEVMQAPAAGQRIGAWRLVEELGSGGMGTVFLVERVDGGFDQVAALKLVRGVATRQSIRQLRHERQVLAALEHPGIARLLDGGETPQGQPWLVVEYIRGEPITWAARRRAMPLAERLRLLREVALAVHHAHRQLVIHRDIKPANVLLREDGRPVLLDFGIAKLLSHDDPAATATAAYFTPAYASPEQRRGGAVSTASDVYALGLLLAELVTERPPQVDAEGQVRAPSDCVERGRRRALRGDIDRIVARACAVEPERRYESAAALANDIGRHLAGEPIRAAPDSAAYKAGKFMRRHPLALSLGALAVLLLVLSGWRIVDERNRALAAEAIAEQQSRASKAVTAYLISLFGEAEPGSGQRSLTPSELIDRSVARLAEDRHVASSERVQLLDALGAIYFRLGLPTKGTRTLQVAVAFARETGDRTMLARALSHLGSALDARGQLADAEQALAEAEALQRALGDAGAAAETLASLGLVRFRLGNDAQGGADLAAAIAQATRVFGGDDSRTLRLRVIATERDRVNGNPQRAREELEAIIPRLQAQLGDDAPEVTEALGYYGNTLLMLDETVAAQAVFERMLSQRLHLLDADRLPLAFVHNGLGMLYYQQGRSLEAAEQMERALQIGEMTLGPDDPSLALDANNVGSIYEDIGDYARAEPHLRRALAIMREAAPEAVATAQFRQNLGRLLMFAGQEAEALALLSEPIDARDDGDWPLQRARQALHLGEWHRRFGRAAQAEVHLAEAWTLFEAHGGSASPRLAAVLRSRGLLALQAGDTDAAERDLRAARERLAGARGEQYLGVAHVDLELADVALRRGQRDEALARIARARPIVEAVAAEAAPVRQLLAELSTRSNAR